MNKTPINKTENNNIKSKPKKLSFPNNPEGQKLETKFSDEKKKITKQTEREHNIMTYSQIAIVLKVENNNLKSKGLESFDDILNKLNTNLGNILNKESDRIKILDFLNKKENKSGTEILLLAQIEAYNNFYKKGTEMGINYESKEIQKQIKKEKNSFEEEFIDSYTKWHKENKEKSEKQYEDFQKTEKPEKLIDSNKITNNTNYSFSSKTGTITTYENGVGSSFELSKQDKELVDEKPELLEKIVDFHKTLKNLGLSNLWNIKDKIFQALQNKHGIGFELKGDYLNKNETFIFLNSILKSVGEESINLNLTTIDGFENKFKHKNNLQFDGGMKDDILKKGESSIEKVFLEKYVNNFTTFQIDTFTKSLNPQKNPTK